MAALPMRIGGLVNGSFGVLVAQLQMTEIASKAEQQLFRTDNSTGVQHKDHHASRQRRIKNPQPSHSLFVMTGSGPSAKREGGELPPHSPTLVLASMSPIGSIGSELAPYPLIGIQISRPPCPVMGSNFSS